MVIYRYNILERVIVENIIPRNMIMNRGAAEVDNHIPRDDFFDYHPRRECYFYIIYYIICDKHIITWIFGYRLIHVL